MAVRDSYYTALVCASGHPVTSRLEVERAKIASFCTICGEPTLDECLDCAAPIRGQYVPPADRAVPSGTYRAPAYCHNCGAAYPWTDRALAAARALIDESELDDADRDVLKGSLQELSRDTPDTALAAIRFKRVSSKLGVESLTALKTIMIAVATEAVKQQLFR